MRQSTLKREINDALNSITEVERLASGEISGATVNIEEAEFTLLRYIIDLRHTHLEHSVQCGIDPEETKEIGRVMQAAYVCVREESFAASAIKANLTLFKRFSNHWLALPSNVHQKN